MPLHLFLFILSAQETCFGKSWYNARELSTSKIKSYPCDCILQTFNRVHLLILEICSKMKHIINAAFCCNMFRLFLNYISFHFFFFCVQSSNVEEIGDITDNPPVPCSGTCTCSFLFLNLITVNRKSLFLVKVYRYFFKLCISHNTGIVCRAENEKTALICKETQTPQSSVWQSIPPQSIFHLVVTKPSHYVITKPKGVENWMSFGCLQGEKKHVLDSINKSASNWDLTLLRFVDSLWKFNAQYKSGFSLSYMCWYGLLVTPQKLLPAAINCVCCPWTWFHMHPLGEKKMYYGRKEHKVRPLGNI